MEKIYDLVIIGAGPAGLSAAIYAQRAKLETLVIDKDMVSGGQVLTTYEVDNYPGLPGIDGFELGTKFREHADQLGAKFVTDRVERVEIERMQPMMQGIEGLEEEKLFWGTEDLEKRGEYLEAAELEKDRKVESETGRRMPKEAKLEKDRKVFLEEGIERDWETGIQDKKRTVKHVICEENSYKARAVLIATGARHQKLEVLGEERLSGMGVSYCATCDGAFFRNKQVAVIGGGDVALEDAVFLSRLCEKVYLIHRRDTFRGAKSLQERVFKQEKIEILWDTVVEEIQGETKVERLKLKNKKTGLNAMLDVQGVFIAVGITPNSQIFEGLVEMERGYIRAGEDTKTSVPGIFAAGDVRTKQLRQIVTAAADGANGVAAVEQYLAQE